ncbi:DNA translocase FtsK [Salinicoccus roseus]|jgi:S-DNA-T family DNA segregation ATPase FtsK/SpoIIIE|uniref:DNA translocase FtsK n=1 Tax=Salinicoccus roseus TaxID=45670 RepID=UPI002300BCEE|nr:DNA translocase FtsK [Salinicoccus roseus]
MDRSRRRRQFNRNLEEERTGRERFRFPLDMDEKEGREAPAKPAERSGKPPEDSDLIRREQQKSLLGESRYSRKRPRRNTISKARAVPSAIHGSKGNPDSARRDETEASSGDQKSGYSSPIVEELKRERAQRERKQRERMEKRAEEAEAERSIGVVTGQSGKAKVEQEIEAETDAEIDTQESGTDVQESGTGKKSTSPFNVMMTPYDKNKYRAKTKAQAKRSGPKNTLPPLHILGEGQDGSYDSVDEALADEVAAAFDAIGVPVRVVAYRTNGIVGRFELSMKRNFRLNVVGKLKEHLLSVMPFEDFKLIVPIAGTSNIGVEFILPEPYPIPFSTLFSSSSLKLRKNDFKFVVGKTVDDQIFSFPLKKAGQILVYGGAEEYSSAVVDNILFSLMMNHNPRELQIMIASDKAHYREYEGLPHMFSTSRSITDKHVLKDILEELNNRHNQFRRAHVRNLDSFNQRVGNDSKKSVIVVVIDDLAELFEHNNPEAIRAIVQILKKGKPLGVHLIMNHSRDDVGLRFELLQMMQTRISFKDGKSKVVDGAKELTEGNDMMIQIPTSNKPLRVNAGVLTQKIKEDVLSHLKGIFR